MVNMGDGQQLPINFL